MSPFFCKLGLHGWALPQVQTSLRSDGNALVAHVFTCLRCGKEIREEHEEPRG